MVVGVHSAKFYNEREGDKIRQAYGNTAWPTLVPIDPEGYVVGVVTGEGNFKISDKKMGELVSLYRSKNLINDTPISLSFRKIQTGTQPSFFSCSFPIDKFSLKA